MIDAAATLPPLPTAEFLLGLPRNPPAAAREATRSREILFGKVVRIHDAPPCEPMPEVATILREGKYLPQPVWPASDTWRPQDRVIVQVEPAQAEDYARWLLRLDPPAGCSLALFSRTASGLHRLWCCAAARTALGAHVHIEARHDLIGIRLAQLSLGFGADTLGGPVAPDRVLPLAGVTRPNEATLAGLSTLATQAGYEPRPITETTP